MSGQCQILFVHVSSRSEMRVFCVVCDCASEPIDQRYLTCLTTVTSIHFGWIDWFGVNHGECVCSQGVDWIVDSTPFVVRTVGVQAEDLLCLGEDLLCLDERVLGWLVFFWHCCRLPRELCRSRRVGRNGHKSTCT